MSENKIKAYEVGVYANDGGYRGYIADLKTNLNKFRTRVCAEPAQAKYEMQQAIANLRRQGATLFYQDGFTSL